jgi:hypothetical protein
VSGADPGLGEERDLGVEGVGCAEEEASEEEVGDGTGEGDETGVGLDRAWAFRSEGHDASDGKEKDGTEFKADVGGSDGAGELTDRDGEADGDPEADATGDSASGGGGEGAGEEKEQREGDVNTEVDTEEPS